MRITRGVIGAIALGVAALTTPIPALADTRAGVDAWSKGDFSGAVAAWQAEVAKGDADAMFNLAQAYKLGRGVKQDLARAEQLYGEAAKRGHLQAADNYGLFLFQRGERQQALPYLRDATARGDARAQYLIGLAYYNGDLLPKDWVRGYALISLATQQGLEPARAARAQMDQYVPLDQRQQAVVLAEQLAREAQATRARQLAAADLGSASPAATPMPGAASIASAPTSLANGAASAGADYARPAVTVHSSRAPAQIAAPVASPVKAEGSWRIQLGAFGQAANADALWARLKGRAEVAGRPRADVRAGGITKLQAAGYSEAAARAACARLSAAGFSCIPIRN